MKEIKLFVGAGSVLGLVFYFGMIVSSLHALFSVVSSIW